MQTTQVPNRTSLHIRPENHKRLSRFKEAHSVVPLNSLLNRALEFYLDYAEQGVDGNLTPIKRPKI
jgi:hypothetical protein